MIWIKVFFSLSENLELIRRVTSLLSPSKNMQFCNEQISTRPLFAPLCASATYSSARMYRRKNNASAFEQPPDIAVERCWWVVSTWKKSIWNPRCNLKQAPKVLHYNASAFGPNFGHNTSNNPQILKGVDDLYWHEKNLYDTQDATWNKPPKSFRVRKIIFWIERLQHWYMVPTVSWPAHPGPAQSWHHWKGPIQIGCENFYRWQHYLGLHELQQ